MAGDAKRADLKGWLALAIVAAGGILGAASTYYSARAESMETVARLETRLSLHAAHLVELAKSTAELQKAERATDRRLLMLESNRRRRR